MKVLLALTSIPGDDDYRAQTDEKVLRIEKAAKTHMYINTP